MKVMYYGCKGLKNVSDSDYIHSMKTGILTYKYTPKALRACHGVTDLCC
jgi:hypothetical protein